MKKKIDFKKPVQTRSGCKVRVICTDRKSNVPYPVIALISMEDGTESALYYNDCGRYCGDNREHPLDLINIPVKRKGKAFLSNGKNSP